MSQQSVTSTVALNRRGALTAVAAALVAAPHNLRAAGLTPLRLGTQLTDSSAEPFYGLDRSFFKDADLDVDVQILNGSQALVAAVATGRLDIGFGSTVPVAQAHLHGFNLRFVAPATVYDGITPTTVIMVAKDSTVKNAVDLNGQTIAVNGLRDNTQFTMQAWLDKNGGNVNSVKFIETPFPEMGVALETRRVAAAVLVEPFWTEALSHARLLANASAAIGTNYMVTGWFASNDWLEKNSGTAKQFQTVMLQIAHWANTHHTETQPIVSKYTKITPEVAARMVRPVLGTTKPSAELIQPVLDVAVKYGGIQMVRASDLVWQG